MMRWTIVLSMCAVMAAPLAAQNPDARRQMLQQQVVERFLQNYRTAAGLTDEQFARFQQVTRQSFEARGRLAERERDTWMALQQQMRPGIAANEDSVVSLLNATLEIQQAHVDQARHDMDAYAEFLSPIQRAQLAIAWRRLQMQIEGVRGRMMPGMRRQGGGGGGGGPMGP